MTQPAEALAHVGKTDTAPGLTPERVREALLAVWGRQACRRPEDWPAVLGRLLHDGPASPGGSGYGRASLAPLVDSAVATLTAAFANGPPSDPLNTIWRAFPRLDAQHRAELSALLIAEGRP